MMRTITNIYLYNDTVITEVHFSPMHPQAMLIKHQWHKIKYKSVTATTTAKSVIYIIQVNKLSVAMVGQAQG